MVLDEVKKATLSFVEKRRRKRRLFWSLGAHGGRRGNAKARAYPRAIGFGEIQLKCRGRRRRSKWSDEGERAATENRGLERQRDGGGYSHRFDK